MDDSRSPMVVYPPSSSSSSPHPLPAAKYEVFLSFRGPDVRTTFADHLYSRLMAAKIRTFRDEEELTKGELIAPSLVQAITESKIHIPIFSQNYAGSKWCLQELAKMVECWKQGEGHIILPIFHFMDPRDVRHQKGPFEEAFELHGRKHDPDTVMEWRNALRQVGKLKGWTVKDSDGRGAIIDKVFSRVDDLLMMNYKSVGDQDFVGIDFHVEELTKLLDLDSKSVELLSIHGIGGIGKTTISKAVYDKVYAKFDGCCFIEDVRSTLLKNKGILALQNKIISAILRRNDRVEDTSKGFHLIEDRVCKHKVLIVLDDVDDTFEFDKILGKISNFSAGSRFLITTRDTVLSFCQEFKSYELGGMNHEHSLQLFSKHAFKMDYPPKGYVTLSDKFVEAAAGLPLALKVIGSLLFRIDQTVWEEKLIQLREVPPSEVQKRLKISYGALSYEVQQIFLDIACFFIGEDKKLPVYMWSACKFYPEEGINTLILRSLIKVNDKNEFWMHDQIRDLGRAIVRDEDVENPGNRSRIWSADDALDMLKREQGTVNVRALKVHLNCEFTNEEFRNLSRLRYLEVKGARLVGDFTEILRDIRLLRLHSCSSIPTRFEMDKLVTLVLEDVGVTDDWEGWTEIKMARKLKVIALLSCSDLRRAPDLSRCEDLELIHFEVCVNMAGELHIGNMKRLRELHIMGCEVAKLTGNVEKLKKLEVINFFAFGGVTQPLPKLPRSIKKLFVTASVPNLSDLKNLEELRFKRCYGVLRVAEQINKLSAMKILKIDSALHDSLLVENASHHPLLPSSLTCLHVHGDELLQRLPSFANLNNLTELSLRCVGVTEVHDLGAMRLLKDLEVSEAPNLNNLDGLENLVLLTYLTIDECCALVRLPSLAALSRLCCVDIRGCPGLADFEGLKSLVGIERLELEGCESVERLPSLRKLNKMKTLILNKNTGLREIGRFGRSNSLLHLVISGCDSLEQFPNIVHLKYLDRLRVHECQRLKELTGLEGLKSLEVLEVEHCGSMTMISNLSTLQNLNQLNIGYCNGLTTISNLSTLENLKQLKIEHCSRLTEITGFEGLKSLVGLELTDLPLVNKLTGLSCLRKLKSLWISGLTKLAEVAGLERLKLLEAICICDCMSTKKLSDLSRLKRLKRLDLKRTNLKEVTGVEGLDSLEHFDLVDCKSMRQLPDVTNLENLRHHNFYGS